MAKTGSAACGVRVVVGAICLCVGSLSRGEGASAKEFVLAKDGQPKAVIVAPAGSPEAVQLAAYELTTHLKKVTGATFEVVGTRPGQGNAIILGDNAVSRAAGIDVSKLKRDGYVVSVTPGTVYIAGRDDGNEKSKILLEYMAEELPKRAFTGYPIHWDFQRATLYGTYRFLEELGVRWFFPGPEGTIVPQTKNLSVGCMNLKEEPCFEMRRGTNPWCHRSKPTQVILRFDVEELNDYDWSGYECKLWLLRQREDSVHMGHNHRPHCHNWIDRFHESNPDYFALQKDGKRSFEVSRTRALLCYTNEGVYQETLKDVEAFFTGKRPDTRGMRYNEPYALNNGWSIGVSYGDTFSLLPNDGGQFCQCENCQKLRTGESLLSKTRESKLIWPFVARVARHVEKSFPGKKIVCLAYSAYTQPPEGMKSLPDNVVVGICPYGLSAPYGHARPSTAEAYLELVKRWHAMNRQPVLVWDHYLFRYFNRDKKGCPMVLPHLLAKHFRDLSPYAKWVTLQFDMDAPTFELLNRYVFMRVLWNPHLDVDALLDDYFQKLYGPAAPVVQEFMKEVEERSGKIAAAKAGLKAIWETHYPPELLVRYRKRVNDALVQTKGTPHEEPTRYFSKWFLGSMEKACFSYVEHFQKLYANKELYMHCPRLDGEVKIDGDLSDQEWQNSASRGHLFNNIDGKKTQWPTHLRIAYDDDDLYVAFTCLDPETPKRSAEARHDYLEVFLDPDRECERYYWMMINIDGTVISEILFSEGGDRIDDKWKSKAKIGTKRHKDRWIVELAIPFESLGGEPADDVGGEMWGANFCRTMSAPPERKDRFSGFSPVLRGAFHRPDSFGAIMFGE